MKRAVCLILVLILCILFAVPCLALENEAVRVAVIDYPNYLMMNEDGSVSGYAYEYLMEIQKYTGWKYEFIEMSLSQACNALEHGEIDLLPGNQYTEDCAAIWDYSKRDMGEGGTVLCVMPENSDYAYNDFSSFGGMRIGAIAGSVRIEQTKEKLNQYGVQAVFVEYATDEESKKALRNGEIDAVLMSTIRCEAAYKIIARLQSTPLYFCTNKQHPELIQSLNKAMDEIHLLAPYYEQKLDQKYYGNVYTQTALSAVEQAYTKSAAPIVVAISTDMAPSEYYDKDSGEYRGIIPDTLALVSAYTGLSFTFVPRESTRILNEQLMLGEVQLVASVACVDGYSSSLEMTPTRPFYDDGIAVVAKDIDLAKSSFDGTMILKSGYPFFEWIAETRGYTNLCYANSFDACLDAVEKGDASFTLISGNSVGILLDHAYYADLNYYFFPDGSNKFGFGVSNYANPLLLSVLNKAIASITNEQRTQILIKGISAAAGNATLRDFTAEHRPELLAAVIFFSLLIGLLVTWNLRKIKKINARLRAEAIRADKSSSAKSDFLSRMSHDIRTPLNAVLGFTALARQEGGNPSVTTDYLEKIEDAGHYLLGLINDVLDMSKISEGKLVLNLEPYSYYEFESSIRTILSPKAEQKGVKLLFHYQITAPETVLFDKLRLQQVFVNLIGNAIKFTPRGGTVEFSVVSDEPTKDGHLPLTFSVRDNGIGMSEDFMKNKLFHAFEQERSGEAQSEAGTGLGLSIAKQIVEQMGGSIECESALGKGTVFTVKLCPVMGPKYEECSQESLVPHGNLNGKRVLLFEDNPINVLVAQRLLEKAGCTVDTAKNGIVGVDLFTSAEVGYYDIILMDIQMPELNGLQAAKIIRGLARPDAATIPIIAMSANAFFEDVQKSLHAGMNEHLSKPIDPQKMYETLSKLLFKKS